MFDPPKLQNCSMIIMRNYEWTDGQADRHDKTLKLSRLQTANHQTLNAHNWLLSCSLGIALFWSLAARNQDTPLNFYVRLWNPKKLATMASHRNEACFQWTMFRLLCLQRLFFYSQSLSLIAIKGLRLLVSKLSLVFICSVSDQPFTRSPLDLIYFVWYLYSVNITCH